MEQRAVDHEAGPKGKNTVVPKQVTGTRLRPLPKVDMVSQWDTRSGDRIRRQSGGTSLGQDRPNNVVLNQEAKAEYRKQSEVFISQANKVQGRRQQSESEGRARTQ